MGASQGEDEPLLGCSPAELHRVNMRMSLALAVAVGEKGDGDDMIQV